MVQTIQIVAGIITILGIARAIVLFKKRKLETSWFIFWIVVWGGVGVVAFVPATSYMLAHLIGVQQGLDLLIYLSILTLFYLVFKLSMKIESMTRDITSVVRELALRKK